MLQKIFMIVAAVCMISGIDSASALDTAIQVSAGYDSNASRKSVSESSPFIRYGLTTEHQLFPQDSVIVPDIYLHGAYQDYFQLGDNYEIKAGGAITVPLKNKTVLPSLIFDALTYRDDLVPEDEREERMIGGELRWHVSGRVTLDFRQTWTWLDYRLPFITDITTLPLRPGRNPIANQNILPGIQEIDQKDRLTATAAEGTVFISPEIYAHISVGYGNLNSSVKSESATQKSVGLSVNWAPGDRWDLEGGFTRTQINFKHVPAIIDRDDTMYSAWSSVTHHFSIMDIFIRGDWTHNNSCLDHESYHRLSIQCGLEYSF